MKQESATAEIKADSHEHNKASPEMLDVSREGLLHLLRKHGVVDIVGVEYAAVEDAIPTLRKAKVKLPEDFFRELAAKLQLPFLSLAQLEDLCTTEYACRYITALPYRVIEEYLIVPLKITDSIAELASANPLNRKAMLLLQALLGKRLIKWFVVSIDAVEMAKERVYREIHQKKALLDLYYRNPDESAYKVLTKEQKVFIFAVWQIFLIALIVSVTMTFALLFALVNIVYFLINPFKIYIAVRGFQGSRGTAHLTYEQLSRARDEDLP
ncbi:MAG: hypothetical protein QXZ70_09455, partial [Candidatus Bathyarchaeia archaeon]